MKNFSTVQFLLIVTVLMCYTSVKSQDQCGTTMGRSPWLQHFQANIDLYRTNVESDSVINVPMALHMIRRSDGTGQLTTPQILDGLCRLNVQFEQANIRFRLLNDEILYHDNDDWYILNEESELAKMFLTQNENRALNAYIISHSDTRPAAGVSFYNFGVIIAKAELEKIKNHTWAHEIGHQLSLPHTFYGWDLPGTIPDFSRPAPEYLVGQNVDLDSMFNPIIIIDTVPVERVSQINCHNSGDGFCDTPPDYLGRRWSCDHNGFSLTRQLDPDSVAFYSDGRNIMGYASDACIVDFSADQELAMRMNLLEEKDYDINTDEVLPIVDAVNLLFPEDGEQVATNAIMLEWGPVDQAVQYLVQISRIPTFSLLAEEAFVEDEQYQFDNANAGLRYYWRVKPVGTYDFCQPFSEDYSFTATDVTSTSALFDEVEVYQSSNSFIIEGIKGHECEVEVYSLSGHKIVAFETQIDRGVRLDMSSANTGVHILHLRKGDKKGSQKVFYSSERK